jgi:hypothetical protein
LWGITANLRRERARFIWDVSRKGRELSCVRLPALNKMERGAKWGLNEVERDDWYKKDHIDSDLETWRILRHRYDVIRGVF